MSKETLPPTPKSLDVVMDICRKIKKIPIWNFHGDADKAVSVENSRKIVEALKKAGF